MSNRRLAFIISFTYVILATIYAYWAMWHPGSDGILHYIFLPASLFPMLIFFTESQPMLWILASQSITATILWLLLWLIAYGIRTESHS